MRDDQPLPLYYKFSCTCGAQVKIKIDPSQPERHVACPKCDMKLDFIVTPDTNMKRSRVSIVVPLDAVRLEGESLAARKAKSEPPKAAPAPPSGTRAMRKSTGKTMRGVLGTCICGASFPVDEEELTSIQACPECRQEYHVVVKMEPGTRKKTAILIPVKPPPGRTIANRVPVPAPPPPAEEERAEFAAPPAKSRTRLRTPKETPKPRAPAQLPPGAQSVTCDCGEVLVVRRKDVATGIVCTGCGRAIQLQEVRHPQTLAPIVRIRPASE